MASFDTHECFEHPSIAVNGRDRQRKVTMSMDLSPADTRVFLFYTPNAEENPSAAFDDVNQWLNKDRSASQYSNLRVKDISVTPDGKGGIYTTVVCALGRISTGAVHTAGARDQMAEGSAS
jgi:hypothetical protein